MAVPAISLEDKYTLAEGRVYVTGLQALVRLLLMQRERDRREGLRTAGFVSGYRGSPLGGMDQQLWQARDHLARHDVHFQPGLNEDLAATAVWGTQQGPVFRDFRCDGVFSLWYGKGPGVDRSGDALRHGNMAGSDPRGGVLLVAGDDHTAKSSTTAHQTEYAFADLMIPVLSPAGLQEFLDLGLLGFALSRYSGCWVAFKTVSEIADSSATVSVDPDRISVVTPAGFDPPPGGLGMRWPDPPLEQEERLHRYKLPAVLAFARANAIDRVVLDGPRRRVGVVASGKAYLDLRQALDDLGLDEARAAALGLSVYKVGMPWPLEGEGIRRFARGLDEILVVEEKRPLIEDQLRSLLYGVHPAPRVFGKQDRAGRPLLPSWGELDPVCIARVLVERLGRGDEAAELWQRLRRMEGARRAGDRPPMVRLPWFCSGCPHNTSTRVPEGSRALAGIGCHYMVMWMDRNTETFTHMGGEGAPWIGQAPFSRTGHVFANLGDGTYYHSGSLAIRACIAAGVNITFKILYNDAVAMTGGQPVDGPLDPAAITRQLRAEGVKRIVVVSDEPDKYPPATAWAAGVEIRHRRELDRVQRELRDLAGVTVLLYDQTCAAEKRRRRKRGLYPDPPKRAFINRDVCEGCGDCGRQSNCMSVVPVETEFGTRRAIDQSSCNKDFSCVEGFCPSFVSVHGGRRRRRGGMTAGGAPGGLPPEPRLPSLDRPWGALVAGVGGTGVVTVGALLGMAAHIEGLGGSVLDMTGLAQKGGAVLSHVRLAGAPEDLHAARLSRGGADLLLGADLVVAAGFEATRCVCPGTTRAVVNTHETVTGEFSGNPEYRFPGEALRGVITAATGGDRVDFVEATRLAGALTGDAIMSNMFLLGFAWQKGLIPLRESSLLQAIELNGVAVESNREAFAWGRRTAWDPASVERLAGDGAWAAPARSRTLGELEERRAAELADYQNAAYAARYRDLVARARGVEEKVCGRAGPLTEAVARSYYRLLACKDEYEVARLYTRPEFRRALEQQFEGDFRLRLYLAPPLLSRPDPATGRPRKREFGPWVFPLLRALAAMRRLRGTPLDPFRYSAERRRDRRLIGEYETLVRQLLAGLTPDNHNLAVQLAALYQQVSGYGPVKAESIERVTRRKGELLEAFRDPSVTPPAEAGAAVQELWH
ncbi:MAG TPA: indolepyruvate ferredoxin oxidoreductase family protein [Gammaproteobacteria bacterium]|nr:indolepyruvate ferredoxin oxidoreductase family protein [Gammaproteobacteria bacterium]